MTTACLTCPAVEEAPRAFDILRGMGLAVSVSIILILPAAMAVVALMQG
jgi:hypothetical protein